MVSLMRKMDFEFTLKFRNLSPQMGFNKIKSSY